MGVDFSGAMRRPFDFDLPLAGVVRIQATRPDRQASSSQSGE